MPKLKAIIFDLDGVIVDTMDLHQEAAASMISKAGLKISKEEMKKYDSMKSSEAFKSIFSKKSDSEIEKMINKKYNWLFEKTRGIKTYPGFFEFFFKLKGKYPLAVCSSSRKSFVEYILKEIGESESFNVIVGAEDVKEGKPSPEGYLKTAQLLGVKSNECLVIEDSIFGITSAKDAGAKVIAITNTYGKNFLLDADLIVDSFAEISIEKIRGLFDD